MKKVFFIFLVMEIIVVLSLSAQNDIIDIYQYTPKNKGYINAGEGFSVQILASKNAIQYNIFNNTRGSTEVLAWKTTSQKVSIITRLRGWNNENEALYYLVEVNANSKAVVKQITGIPIISNDYYLCTGTVNDNAVNIRDKGAIDGNKIGQFSKSNILKFSGVLVNKYASEGAVDYWYRFDNNGNVAWVYGKYISFEVSAKINEYTLGLRQDEGNALQMPASVSKNISELVFETKITNNINPNHVVYDVYNDGEVTIRVENNGTDLYENSKITIFNTDKIVSSIESVGTQYVYCYENNRLYYVTYGWGELNNLNCIDCNNGFSVLIQKDANSGLNIYTDEIDSNPGKSSILFLSQIHTREWEDSPMLAINFLSTKNNSITTIPLNLHPDSVILEFGFLTEDIIYIKGLEKESNGITLYRYNGESLQPIVSGYIDYGMDFDKNGREDWFSFYKASGIPYILIGLNPDFNAEKRSIIIGLEGNNFKEYNSMIIGSIINTFYYNDKWYFGTIDYTDQSQAEGTVYIYDSNLKIVNQGTVKCNEYSWGTIISKIGVNNDKIFVVFRQMSK